MAASSTKPTPHADYKLFKSSADLNTWTHVPTPTEYFGLTTYHSQPVLVGGKIGRDPTNKLWTSPNGGLDWVESLPPMPTSRWSPSVVNTGTPECLIVAGGFWRMQRSDLEAVFAGAAIAGAFLGPIGAIVGGAVATTLGLGTFPSRHGIQCGNISRRPVVRG